MHVIGVIDLLRGQAVRARGGHRQQYEPVSQVAGLSIDPGDAVALARAYVQRIGLTQLYVADLDAILGGRGQAEVIATITALDVPIWLDAAVSSVEITTSLLRPAIDRVVVGLETLPSFDALKSICESVPRSRIAFSLDLRDGEPIVMDTGLMAAEPPDVLAARAAECGVSAVIAIDLARVGTGNGPDVELVSRVRASVPHLFLVAGGGVRDADDLKNLADAGCDAVLVASALQDGRLTGTDVRAVGKPDYSVTR